MASSLLGRLKVLVPALMLGAMQAGAQTPTQAPAAPDGTAQPGGNPGNQFLFVMIAVFAVMYFLTIRPNQKREKERREMLSKLAKGDKVVTSSGICGTIVGLTDKTVVLRVSDDSNVKMEFLRGAIGQVTSRDNSEQQ